MIENWDSSDLDDFFFWKYLDLLDVLLELFETFLGNTDSFHPVVLGIDANEDISTSTIRKCTNFFLDFLDVLKHFAVIERKIFPVHDGHIKKLIVIEFLNAVGT